MHEGRVRNEYDGIAQLFPWELEDAKISNTPMAT